MNLQCNEFCLIKAAVLGFDQGQKAFLKAEGKTVYLPCKVTGQSYIHWYQMKDGEAPSRLLYISQRGDVTRDTNNPQANDFTVDKTKLYDLKLTDIQKSCCCLLLRLLGLKQPCEDLLTSCT